MNGVTIHWGSYSTTKGFTLPDIPNYAHFRAIVVGHKIFVQGGNGTRNEYKSPILFEYNVHTRSWQAHEIGGELPEEISQNSVALIGDQMISFGTGWAVEQITRVHYIDLLQMSWHTHEVSCDKSFFSRNHVADYWEDRGVLLVNACGIMDPSYLYNTTVLLNVNSWTLEHVKCKGSPPTRRVYHSSILLAHRKQWFIVGGESRYSSLGGPKIGTRLNDIYILSFSAFHQPTWSHAAPSRWQEWMPPALCVSLIAHGNRLIVLGGLCTNKQERPTAVYDIDKHLFVSSGVVSTGEVPSANDFRAHQIVRSCNNGYYVLPFSYRDVWRKIWWVQVG